MDENPINFEELLEDDILILKQPKTIPMDESIPTIIFRPDLDKINQYKIQVGIYKFRRLQSNIEEEDENTESFLQNDFDADKYSSSIEVQYVPLGNNNLQIKERKLSENDALKEIAITNFCNIHRFAVEKTIIVKSREENFEKPLGIKLCNQIPQNGDL